MGDPNWKRRERAKKEWAADEVFDLLNQKPSEEDMLRLNDYLATAKDGDLMPEGLPEAVEALNQWQDGKFNGRIQSVETCRDVVEGALAKYYELYPPEPAEGEIVDEVDKKSE